MKTVYQKVGEDPNTTTGNQMKKDLLMSTAWYFL